MARTNEPPPTKTTGKRKRAEEDVGRYPNAKDLNDDTTPLVTRAPDLMANIDLMLKEARMQLGTVAISREKAMSLVEEFRQLRMNGVPLADYDQQAEKGPGIGGASWKMGGARK